MATAYKLLVALFLSCFVSAAFGEYQEQRPTGYRLTRAQQCRFQRLAASQPSQRIESEAGVTELWDEFEEQFQCAGVAAIRSRLQPNGLSLPNFQPTPRVVYIERGQGLLGITFPGCAETFHSQAQPFERRAGGEGEQEERGQERYGGQRRDQHQKVHRIRQGDIIAIPAGAAHWCFNDGNEELVAISVNDLNHRSNQLDQKFRAFYLAGAPARADHRGVKGEHARETFQNIFRAFDAELMAEAYNIPSQIVRQMQSEDERGLIVYAREMRTVIRPDDREEYEQGRGREFDNGLEETLCTTKIRTNIDSRREVDIYSRQAGKLHIVNSHKLPILRAMDMSAEKGRLYPNALLSPHWSMNGHSICYATRGEAQIQVVDHSGQTVMNDRVNQGDMFVVPQYFTTTFRAGRDGFEWVNIKTTGTPMRSPLVGYTSVIRAMPLQVITNAYQISPREAQDLKFNRGAQSLMLSPGRRSSY